MRARALGSSSKGNCYLLESDSEILIIEAGIRFTDIKKGLGYDLTPVVGCLITHEHGDHAKAVVDTVKAGVDVYLTAGTAEALGVMGHRVHCIKYQQPFRVGDFEVLAFNVEHDAKEPAGFLIRHPEMGALLFATDTCSIRHRFQTLNHIFVECNFSEALLEHNVQYSKMPNEAKGRLIKSHMSLRELESFLTATNLTTVQTIMLLHLSDENSDARLFQQTVWSKTGIKPSIADTGIEIALNLYPF